MKTTKVLRFMLALLFVAGCSQPSKQGATGGSDTVSKDSGSHYPVKITNYNYSGEEIALTFEKPPERVLAVYQGSIETMIALGLEDRVIASYGLDNEVKPEWKDGFSKMKYNETAFAPDKETVVMLRPDLIFSWGSLFGEKTLGDVDYWISNGANTYMNTNTRAKGQRLLENEYTDILNIGKIFDVEGKAQALVDQMKADVEKAQAKAKEMAVAPTVAIIGFYDDGIRNYGLELAGDIASKLSLNVMQSSERYMGKEDLIALNPDVIFIEYMPRPDKGGEEIKGEQISKLMGDPAFASMSAVSNKRVYPIMLGDIYAPAVRVGDGIRTIAEGVFPGIFDK